MLDFPLGFFPLAFFPVMAATPTSLYFMLSCANQNGQKLGQKVLDLGDDPLGKVLNLCI